MKSILIFTLFIFNLNSFAETITCYADEIVYKYNSDRDEFTIEADEVNSESFYGAIEYVVSGTFIKIKNEKFLIYGHVQKGSSNIYDSTLIITQEENKSILENKICILEK